jgi:hypothetical protein
MKHIETFITSLHHLIHLAKPLLIELMLLSICAVELYRFFMASVGAPE